MVWVSRRSSICCIWLPGMAHTTYPTVCPSRSTLRPRAMVLCWLRHPSTSFTAVCPGRLSIYQKIPHDTPSGTSR